MNPRDNTIGASDVPGILGLSPWQSPSAVWARLKGLTESQPSDATRRGHTLELGILMEYADRNGLKAYRWQTSHRHLHRQRPPYRAGLYRGPGIQEGRMIYPAFPWAGCRPDAIVLHEDGTRHLVEVKTTRSFRDWQDADGNSILPPHYVVQVQWQMMVTDTDVTHLEAFCTFDDSRRSYTVAYDAALASRIFGLVQDWRFRHIIGDDLPDNMPAEIAGLVWPAPREPESWLDATAEDRATMLRYDALGAQLKELETERDGCKDKLINRIQDNTGIDGLCSWRATKRGRQFRSLL
jgi:hypothetical protein